MFQSLVHWTKFVYIDASAHVHERVVLEILYPKYIKIFFFFFLIPCISHSQLHQCKHKLGPMKHVRQKLSILAIFLSSKKQKIVCLKYIKLCSILDIVFTDIDIGINTALSLKLQGNFCSVFLCPHGHLIFFFFFFKLLI